MGKKTISAVVLAGGNSTRMGRNKALLKLGSKTMIESVVDTLQSVFSEVIVITNHPEEYPMLRNVGFAKDQFKTEEKNSLVGLYTGLATARNEYIFVTACDMPLLNPSLLQYMKDHVGKADILIPFFNGHYQPLHAIYGKKCLLPMGRLLINKDYKILNFFHEVKVEKLEEEIVKRFDPHFESFLNINNHESYEELMKMYFSRKVDHL